MNCSAISAIVALCLLAAPLSAQRLTSNTATVQLTLVIPESAGMNVTLNDNNTATVTVAYNLEKPPMSVGVKYGGQVYEQLCNGEPCTAKNGGALSAQGEARITVPLRGGDAMGFETFELVLVEG
jgi:hypothetical protein